jgi:aerobic-type carbon monoxide dehydrogenase small subunit (CoxS/CutS family)
MTDRVRLRVNGEVSDIPAEPLRSLGDVLGEELGLRSVRQPCGVGACGACTVLVANQPVKSCLQAAALVGDREVVTTESLPPDDPVLAAFAARNAFQCGYCVPGFVMSTRALLAADPAPTPEVVREGLAGNLCRCGSYSLILEAVLALVSAESTPDRGVAEDRLRRSRTARDDATTSPMSGSPASRTSPLEKPGTG